MMDHGHDTGEGPYTGNYLDYLLTNRTFTDGAVAAAVRSLIPAVERCTAGRPVRILDAGTGAGGALLELKGLCDRHDHGGTVLAVDTDHAAVELAHKQTDGVDGLDIRAADLRDAAAIAVSTGEKFDLIWSSDVIWPVTFDDPGGVVDELCRALVPGGRA